MSSGAIDYEPLAPESWQDPYPVYRRLRDEAPVHRSPGSGFYCVSRYEDVAFVLRQPDLFSSESAFETVMQDHSRRIGFSDAVQIARFLWANRINPLRPRRSAPGMLIITDPPRHAALRAIVNRGFTPRRVQAWEPRMREIVAGCMARLRAGEPFDVVRDLAIPLPVTVIAEMLGIDPERRADFKRWGDEMIAGSTGSRRTASIGSYLRTMNELRRYLRTVIAERRRAPADDLISVLVDPRHGETLDDAGVVGFITLLLIAGNETTTNLIGNATMALLDHPGELERVLADPRLVGGAVEEALRYEPPIHYVLRRATRDVELCGTTIPGGAKVVALLASAGRDERQFPDPERFDVTRGPKGHLSFGLGLHFCLGASLARLEGRIALEALVPELPRLRRAPGPTRYVDSFLVRGPESLELVAAA